VLKYAIEEKEQKNEKREERKKSGGLRTHTVEMRSFSGSEKP
jgi:hypothetical protein